MLGTCSFESPPAEASCSAMWERCLFADWDWAFILCMHADQNDAPAQRKSERIRGPTEKVLAAMQEVKSWILCNGLPALGMYGASSTVCAT